MNTASDNPDRNFSADFSDDGGAARLRDLLKSSEVADLFAEEVRNRIGELIGRATFDPAKQRKR